MRSCSPEQDYNAPYLQLSCGIRDFSFHACLPLLPSPTSWIHPHPPSQLRYGVGMRTDKLYIHFYRPSILRNLLKVFSRNANGNCGRDSRYCWLLPGRWYCSQPVLLVMCSVVTHPISGPEKAPPFNGSITAPIDNNGWMDPLSPRQAGSVCRKLLPKS